MADVGSSSGDASGLEKKSQEHKGPVTRSRARAVAALSVGESSSTGVAVAQVVAQPAPQPTLHSFKVVDADGRVYPIDDYADDEPDRANWITGDGADARKSLLRMNIPLTLVVEFEWQIENPLENVPSARVLGTLERLRQPDADQQVLNIGLAGEGGQAVDGQPHRFRVTVNSKQIDANGIAFDGLPVDADPVPVCEEINIADFSFVEVQLHSGGEDYILMPPGDDDPVVRIFTILDAPVRDNVAEREIDGTDRFVTVRHLQYACRWANGANGDDRNALASNVIQRIRHYDDGDNLAALTFWPTADAALNYLSENDVGDQAADENNEGWNVLDRDHIGGDCTQQASLFADVFGLLGILGTDFEIIRVFAYDTEVDVESPNEQDGQPPGIVQVHVIGKVRKGFRVEDGGDIWPVHGVFIFAGDADGDRIVCDTSFSEPPDRSILTLAQTLSVGENHFIHSWAGEWRAIEETNPDNGAVTELDGSEQPAEQLDPHLDANATEQAWRQERTDWLTARLNR